MFNIGLKSSHFPPGTRLPKSFQFSKSKLAWAALTTGKPNKAAVKRHKGFSHHEMLFRWNLVLSSFNLKRTDGYLENSVLFNDMDPSEKGGANFFHGMAFAKMAAQELLDVPWLAHYSWYKKTGQISWQPSRSTADLIGLQASTGDFVVVEAKGCNSHQFSNALKKAVVQAKQNYLVNGKACKLHVGSVLYRQRATDRLAIVWRDPKPQKKDGTLKLETDREFWREYYSSVWDLYLLQKESSDRFETIFGFKLDFAEPAIRLINNLTVPENEFEESVSELIKWSGGRRERMQTEPLENWNGDGVIVKVLE